MQRYNNYITLPNKNPLFLSGLFNLLRYTAFVSVVKLVQQFVVYVRSDATKIVIIIFAHNSNTHTTDIQTYC